MIKYIFNNTSEKEISELILASDKPKILKIISSHFVEQHHQDDFSNLLYFQNHLLMMNNQSYILPILFLLNYEMKLLKSLKKEEKKWRKNEYFYIPLKKKVHTYQLILKNMEFFDKYIIYMGKII